MNTQANHLLRAPASDPSPDAAASHPQTVLGDIKLIPDGRPRGPSGSGVASWFARLFPRPDLHCVGRYGRDFASRSIGAGVALLLSGVLSASATDPITTTYEWPDPFGWGLPWTDMMPQGSQYFGTTKTGDNLFPLFADPFDASGVFVTVGVPNAFGAYRFPVVVPEGQELINLTFEASIANIVGQTGIPGDGFSVCIVPEESRDPLGNPNAPIYLQHFRNDIAGAGAYAGLCVHFSPNGCNVVDTTIANLDDTNPIPLSDCASAIILSNRGEVIERYLIPTRQENEEQGDSNKVKYLYFGTDLVEYYNSGGSPFNGGALGDDPVYQNLKIEHDDNSTLNVTYGEQLIFSTETGGLPPGNQSILFAASSSLPTSATLLMQRFSLATTTQNGSTVLSAPSDVQVTATKDPGVIEVRWVKANDATGDEWYQVNLGGTTLIPMFGGDTRSRLEMTQGIRDGDGYFTREFFTVLNPTDIRGNFVGVTTVSQSGESSAPATSARINNLSDINARLSNVTASFVRYDPTANQLPTGDGLGLGPANVIGLGAPYASTAGAGGPLGLNMRDRGWTAVECDLTTSTTGEFNFHLRGDDQSNFFLSTDSNPSTSEKTASEPNWTSSRATKGGEKFTQILEGGIPNRIAIGNLGFNDPNDSELFVIPNNISDDGQINSWNEGGRDGTGSTITTDTFVDFDFHSDWVLLINTPDSKNQSQVELGEPVQFRGYSNQDPVVKETASITFTEPDGSIQSSYFGNGLNVPPIMAGSRWAGFVKSGEHKIGVTSLSEGAENDTTQSETFTVNTDLWPGMASYINYDGGASGVWTAQVNPLSNLGRALSEAKAAGEPYRFYLWNGTDQFNLYDVTVPGAVQFAYQSDVVIMPEGSGDQPINLVVEPMLDESDVTSGDGALRSATVNLNRNATLGMKVAIIGGTGPDQQARVVPGNFRGDFDVQSGGNQMWGNRDEATFVYETVDGNFDKKVKVEHYEASSPWARLGLCVRKTTDPDSANVVVMMSPSHTADGSLGGDDNQMYARQADGGPTVQPYYITGLGRPWVRLMRRGDEFWGFAAPDGVSWVEVGHIQIPGAPATMCVGPIFSPDRNNVPEGHKTKSFWAGYRYYGDSFANLTLGSDRFERVAAGRPFKTHVNRILRNDIHHEGGILFVTGVRGASPNGATVRLEGDWVIYHPSPGGGATGSFQYRASDGLGAREWGDVTLSFGEPSTNSSDNQSGITLLGNGCVRVSFDGIPGRTYTIQFATEVPSTYWQNIGTAVANDEGVYEFEHCPGGGSAAYYRSVYP